MMYMMQDDMTCDCEYDDVDIGILARTDGRD
jgi:hypothetical protein